MEAATSAAALETAITQVSAAGQEQAKVLLEQQQRVQQAGDRAAGPLPPTATPSGSGGGGSGALQVPAPIAVICGVARGAKTAAIGAFDLVLYQLAMKKAAAAASGTGSGVKAPPPPACILLQRVMKDGQWSAAEPRVLTPAEFVAAAGLKGKNWKQSIRLYADTVVGQPLGTLLDEL